MQAKLKRNFEMYKLVTNKLLKEIVKKVCQKYWIKSTIIG